MPRRTPRSSSRLRPRHLACAALGLAIPGRTATARRTPRLAHPCRRRTRLPAGRGHPPRPGHGRTQAAPAAVSVIPSMSRTRRDLVEIALNACALTASLLVIAASVVRALALVAYPWDWSPDEGLFLDYARRFLEAPATLHGKSFVPYPSAYGPVLSIVLAPALILGETNIVSAARGIALGWTLVGTFACYQLVRRTAPPATALAAAALALAPFDLTFWHVLIRPDGLQQTLWLLAAAVLLPRSLRRNAETLSPARTILGTVLVLAAVLTKATAIFLCAPLVLGWFLVDRPGAVRQIGRAHV